MASLIWEVSSISSKSNFNFRVKMSDGSNMADSDEGVDFINIVNAQDFSKIGLGSQGKFVYSLGLGYPNTPYNSMWTQVEEFYNKVFASLGNSIALANSYGVQLIPFSRIFGAGQVFVTSMYWEQVNYSCIVQLTIQPQNTSWGDSITVDRNGFSPNANIEIGNASWAQERYIENSLIETYDVDIQDIDNYSILVGFILRITGESGIKNIFPVERSAVDSAISEERINYDSGTIPFAPVRFRANLLDFSVNILSMNRPQFVYEAQSEPMQLQIKSEDYNGEIKIYLIDNDSIAQVNEDIASDLSDWYGEISEDVIAQYGVLDYNGQKIITDSIVAGETKAYEITYTPYNVNVGQTDSMSIFIKSNAPDFSYYTQEQTDEWFFYNILPSSHFDYTDNIEIDILDVSEEYIEIYNPSDNLITQPADIIHHIFGEELGFDKDNIDLSSKTESRSQHEDFEMAFSINKEIESKKLIQEISQSCKSFPLIASDNLKFITIKNTYTGNEEISTIKADDVFNYSFSRTSVDDIITKVEVKYNKDYGLDTYLDSHIIEAQKPTYFYNGDMSDNFREDNYYGVKERLITGNINHVDSFLDFESPYIRDPDSAYALAEYLFYWNVNQHNIVELKLPLSYYAFEIGDLIEFDKMMLGKKAYGEKYVLGDSDNMPVRAGQYILPLFMITETKKDLDSIKIKAIQLHHMSGNLLTYKGKTYVPLILIKQESQQGEQQNVAGSGDFNGDGLTDILDVVFMVNKIINVESFTDEETLIADVNGDGQVNVLDVIIIVNRIVNG
tara:strand:- start:387 stop:2747 length:2361 start_codon:yes stop_codon:yes gene_type:complete